MRSLGTFGQVATYGVVIGVIDAVSGRTLQASPDPSTLFALLATAWVAYDLAERRQRRIAEAAALTLWATYFVTFIATANLLVGWNNSVPWRPASLNWVMWFAFCAIVVAFMAAAHGKRAAGAASRDGVVDP